MPPRQYPHLGLWGDWDLGENNWKDNNDINLRTLSVLTQCRVISRVTVLPGSPAQGDVYIVPTGEANENQVALYDESAWHYVVPIAGFIVYVADESKFYNYNGTIWVEMATGGGGTNSVEFSTFAAGILTDGEILIRHVITIPCTFPLNLVGSDIDADVAATGSSVFSVKKNGVEFATATIAAAGTSATFAGPQTAFVAGDVLTVTAPATADATLADVSLSFLASET